MNKLTSIHIKNFKFFKEEKIEIKNGKNLLVYGENGSGKSSFFTALKHAIYKITKTSYMADEESFKNLELTNENIDIQLMPNVLNAKYCYFINYQILQKIIESDNIFHVFQNDLNYEFETIFNDIFSTIAEIKNKLPVANEEVKVVQELKERVNTKLKDLLNEIEKKSNEIINEFEEDFQINFIYEDLLLNVETRGIESFELPNIKLTITKQMKTTSLVYLNEARSKTVSLAIYFALIKVSLQTALAPDIKLLVLDDFLLSFDMGNRSFIMKYVFENFQNFQMFILTHNLLFYELVKKLYISRIQQKNWQEMKLYPRINKDGIQEAKAYLQDTNYLDKAKNAINEANPDLDIAGNNTRKALEKLVYEIVIFLEIGGIKLDDMIKSIRKKDTFSINGQAINTATLNQVLQDSQFYKDIALNAMSHSNVNDFYKKEINGAIKNIEEAFEVFKKVKSGEI